MSYSNGAYGSARSGGYGNTSGYSNGYDFFLISMFIKSSSRSLQFHIEILRALHLLVSLSRALSVSFRIQNTFQYPYLNFYCFYPMFQSGNRHRFAFADSRGVTAPT